MSINSTPLLIALSFACLMTVPRAESVDEAVAALDVAFTELGSYSMKTSSMSDISMPGYATRSETVSDVDCEIIEDHYMMRAESTSTTVSVMEGQETKEVSKLLMVCDGERTYVQNDAGGSVTVTVAQAQKLSQVKPSALLASYRQMGELTLLPDREVNGVDCRVIKVAMKAYPGMPPPGHSEFCFRKDNGLMWANRGLDAEGKEVSNTTCSDLDTSVEFEKSHFTYEPPEGAQVIDMTAPPGPGDPTPPEDTPDMDGVDDEGGE